LKIRLRTGEWHADDADGADDRGFFNLQGRLRSLIFNFQFLKLAIRRRGAEEVCGVEKEINRRTEKEQVNIRLLKNTI
jgi:hypothetical protein